MAKQRDGGSMVQQVLVGFVVLAFLALQWLRVQDPVVQSFVVFQAASGPLVSTGELSQGFPVFQFSQFSQFSKFSQFRQFSQPASQTDR